MGAGDSLSRTRGRCQVSTAIAAVAAGVFALAGPASLIFVSPAFAQFAFGDGLAAADDTFRPDEPDDAAVKGLSLQSLGRQIGLTTLKNSVGGAPSGFVEQPYTWRGAERRGDFSPNVLVNDPSLDNIQSFVGTRPFEESTQSETSVAVSGQHVLVGYNSSANQPVVRISGGLAFTHRFLSAYSISHDGGRTFTSGFVPPTPGSVFTFGDPAVGVDRAGHLFYAGLGADAAGNFLIQINRSDDNGNTFGPGVTVAVDDGADKEWLAIGPDPGMPTRDNLYITWTRFTDTSSELWLSRSTDGGATWTNKPLFQPADDGNNSSFVQFSNPVVDASSGRLYVPFLHFADLNADNIRVLVSDDGGNTFRFLAFNVPGAVDAFAYPNVTPGILQDCGTSGGVRLVLHQGANLGGGRFGLPRYRQATRLVTQPAAAAFRGRFLMAFHSSTSQTFSDPNAGSEINVLYSADGGATWAPPLKVARSTTDDPQHVHPAVVLTQNGNRLFVSYYVQQIDERLRTDVARLHVDGNHLRLEDTDRLGSTAFDLTPSNNPFPLSGDPFFTTNYDRTISACYDIGEYQSIGAPTPGLRGPIVAAWGDNRRTWVSPSDSPAPGPHAQPDVFSKRIDDEGQSRVADRDN